MTKITSNPSIEKYFQVQDHWQAIKLCLREIILTTELVEDWKWYKPCYTLNGKNVLLIHGFKDYYAILFLKGVLMQDPSNLLISQTEYVQSARQIRFTNLEELTKQKETIREYILEAIKVEQSGKEVIMKKTSEFVIPLEFENELTNNPELSVAFDKLTPGRRRGYLLHFSGAKLSKTRQDRVAKHIPRILNGKGLDD